MENIDSFVDGTDNNIYVDYIRCKLLVLDRADVTRTAPFISRIPKY